MPPSIRHVVRPLRSQVCLSYKSRRCYHSPESGLPSSFSPSQAAVLEHALPFIRHHGFSLQSIAQGCAAAGYPPAAAAALVPRGAFDLVAFHLARQRAELQTKWQEAKEDQRNIDIEARLRDLILLRLRANLEDGVAGRWSEALALMSLPSHIPTSLHELALLADEICHLANDAVVDGRWYARRAAVSAVYASAELYMGGLAASAANEEAANGQPQTTHEYTEKEAAETATKQRAARDEKVMAETAQFVDRRVDEWRSVKGAVGDVGQWLGFNAGEAVALARSWGWRI